MKKRKGQGMNSAAVVKSNLADLIARRNQERKLTGDDPITIEGIYRDTRIAVNTIRKYLRGGHKYFDASVVATLCNYLGCELSEMLEIVDVGESEDTEDQTPLE